jgi:Ca2+-binding RTX toxin-like protein
MDTHSIFGKRQLAMAAGATLAIGLVTAGPSQAVVAKPSASVADGTLTISGTGGDDEIAVSADAGDPNTLLVDFTNGTPPQVFDRDTFDAITVFLRSGDDQFEVVPGGAPLADEALGVVGGDGNDTILGGDGNDNLRGGSGKDDILGAAGIDLLFGNSGGDFVDGNVGNDTQLLGRGQDDALWNPGEGSDVVNGAAGIDTLIFNGSDNNEIMSLSADGGRAVFLRDLGLIRMDMGHVERLDLAALGGADAVTIGNLTGTDVRSADIDLSAAGVGDGQTDTVTVNGTNKADAVDVDADDGDIDVAGLRAETRIAGSEITDQLVVRSLGGNDTVDVSDAARALINVAVELGTGQR